MTGLAVGLLGAGKFAAQSMEIGLQVEGSADPRPSHGLREALTGSLRLAHRIPPGALQLHELGAVHEALAAIGNEARLRRAPLGQRRRPLPRPVQIEDLLAVLEHRTVDDAHADRRHLAGRDGHHDLIEQDHSLRGLSRSKQGLPEAQPAECHQLWVAEALADPDALCEGLAGGHGIAREQVLKREGHEEIPALHAVVLTVVEEPLTPGDPAAAARRLSFDQQVEGQPERAAGGARRVASLQEPVMRPGVGIGAVGVPADEVSGHRKPFQVVRLECRLAIRGGELSVRIPPRLPAE